LLFPAYRTCMFRKNIGSGLDQWLSVVDGASDLIKNQKPLYWLWQAGKYTNLQNVDLFGSTHSSVNRRVTIIRKKMALEQNFQS